MTDVLLKVKGGDYTTGEAGIELVTEGRLYKKADVYYVSYKETGMTGMEGTTTTLKVEDKKITLIRHGTVSSTFVFEKGKKTISHYSTEFGVFTIGVKAEEVNSKLDEAGGFIAIKYSLDMSGQKPGKNEFLMTISEVKNDLYDSNSNKTN